MGRNPWKATMAGLAFAAALLTPRLLPAADGPPAAGETWKDVKLCLDEAEALGVPLVMGNAARQVLAMSKAEFGPQADFTNMVRLFEQWAGVEVKAATEKPAVAV